MASTLRTAVGDRPRRSSRASAAAAVAIVLVAVLVVARLASERPPALVVHRLVPAEVRLPGSPPLLAWPREGEAAVAVQGVGDLGSSGRQTPVPIASVAKVMTAYLTLREHPLAPGQEGFTITITPSEVDELQQRLALNQSVLPVRVGERISERQALQALLLPSANNVAQLLAIYDAGSEAAFVAQMNATARGLGMTSTTYTDPSGFEDTTVSTAADQLRLAGTAMREPLLAEIVDEPSAELPLVGRVANFDSLIGQEGFVGVKTGSDRAAGGCFVFARRVSVAGAGLTVLGVVLGQREGALIESALASARRLGNSAAAALGLQTALPAGARVVSVSGADGQGTAASIDRPLLVIGWGGLAVPLELRGGARANHLAAGQPVARVVARGGSYASAAALAEHAVGGPSLGWRLGHLL